jgi:hypothetical protein
MFLKKFLKNFIKLKISIILFEHFFEKVWWGGYLRKKWSLQLMSRIVETN